MSNGDLTRINTNIQALRSLTALQNVNSDLSNRQLRLATGSKLNKAEDDSAGYSIAKKLEAKVRGQAQALSNIGDAKSMMTVAEGGLSTVMDILQTMKEKAVQASNDTMQTEERAAIETQLEALTEEIYDSLASAKFNGKDLLKSGTKLSVSFQVGDTDADTFAVSLTTITVGKTATTTDLFTGASSALATVTEGSVNWAVTNATTAGYAIKGIDNAIKLVSKRLSSIGDIQKRLTFKSSNLEVSKSNYEAAKSRIADADFAEEQMHILKLQILQQTGTAALSQANQAPQSVLSLFQ